MKKTMVFFPRTFCGELLARAGIVGGKVMEVTRVLLTTVVAMVLVATSAMIISGDAAAVPLVREGAKVCAGAFFVRDVDGVDELQDTMYVLRNFDDEQTITIERLRAWDRHGVLIWDSESDGLPGDIEPVLGPHEGARFRAAALTVNVANPSEGQFVVIQVRIDYSLDGRGIPLSAGAVRFARIGGIGGFESFRFNAPCRDK